jgi:UDP-N-acetylmuramoyl-L-alanyl-D-glutamate--2,6-diaminopimelate ligase
MGKIAQKFSDRIFVTSDNSRSEKTADIMADIKAGMDTAGKAKSLFIEDREQAIRAAIMMAQQGATILLAGKGHETYQINENGKVHFDEREIVMDAFSQNQ